MVKLVYLPRNNNYSLDFKLKVIKTIQRESLSLRDVSLKFNIPDLAIIVKWKRDFANFGLEGLKPKPKGWRGNVFCAHKVLSLKIIKPNLAKLFPFLWHRCFLIYYFLVSSLRFRSSS